MWLSLLLLIARGTGALFIFSGVSKFMARTAFHNTLSSLPFLPSRIAPFVVVTLPGVEIAIGGALITGILTRYSAIVALALLLVFTLVAVFTVAHGLSIPCSCFGTTSTTPLSRKTVVRNTLLALPLVPLALLNRPSPLSVDALPSYHTNRSVDNVAILLLLLACTIGAAVLIATAQKTLTKITLPRL